MFEDIFLIWSCVISCREMWRSATTQAELEQSAAETESIIERRTAELQLRTQKIVDDEQPWLHGLRRRLGDDYKLVTADSGDAALEQLAAGVDVAVVLTDMRMPGMNGIQLIQQARMTAPDSVYMMRQFAQAGRREGVCLVVPRQPYGQVRGGHLASYPTGSASSASMSAPESFVATRGLTYTLTRFTYASNCSRASVRTTGDTSPSGR